MNETLLRKFEYFAHYCADHGRTLDHHREFSVMATEIQQGITALEAEIERLKAENKRLQDYWNGNEE